MPVPKPINLPAAEAANEAISYYDETSVFSNVYPCHVEYKGIVYGSAEHAYQAQRFDPLEYPTIALAIIEEIRTAPDGVTAKQITKKYRKYKRDNWDQIKFRIMIEVNLAKFHQNPELAQLLIDSEDRLLVEHAPNDNCWGMVTAKDGDAYGSNFAGRILQFVRKKILSEI